MIKRVATVMSFRQLADDARVSQVNEPEACDDELGPLAPVSSVACAHVPRYCFSPVPTSSPQAPAGCVPRVDSVGDFGCVPDADDSRCAHVDAVAAACMHACICMQAMKAYPSLPGARWHACMRPSFWAREGRWHACMLKQLPFYHPLLSGALTVKAASLLTAPCHLAHSWAWAERAPWRMMHPPWAVSWTSLCLQR